MDTHFSDIISLIQQSRNNAIRAVNIERIVKLQKEIKTLQSNIQKITKEK